MAELEMITSVSALILSAASLALLPYKLGQLTLKVNTLWESWMHDAISEGSHQGLLKHGSLMGADQGKVETLLKGLITTFREDKDLRCKDLQKQMEKLERKYGKSLLDISLRNQVSYKGLLIMTAMFLSKGETHVRI